MSKHQVRQKSWKRKSLVAVLLLAFPVSGSLAQTSAPSSAVPSEPPFTLERALALGGAVSPSIAAGTAGVQAATAGRRVAALRPNPEIVVETENVAGSGEYRGLRSAETTAGLALPIELGGKRSARVAVADAQIDRARIGAAIAIADLTLSITQSYIEAAAAERRLIVAREQAGLAAEGARAARVRVTAGAASPIELQRADLRQRTMWRRYSACRSPFRCSTMVARPLPRPRHRQPRRRRYAGWRC